MVNDLVHITSCSTSLQVFGGPQIFGPQYWVAIENTISLPPHYSLSFSFDLIRFGSWNSVLFNLDVDFGSWSTNLNFLNNYNGGLFSTITGSCGSIQTKQSTIEASNIAHNSDTITFSITGTSGLMGTQSWGINNFVINYLACDSACQTCSGPGANECSACLDSGAYLSAPSTCTLCDSTCMNCQGPTNTDCTLCPDDYPYKQNFIMGKGSCLSICPNGQASDSQGNCVNCPTNCLECQYGSPTTCMICIDGFSLNSGVCFQCGSTCKSCNYLNPQVCTECGTAEFLRNGVCYPCSQSCATCYEANDFNCLTCNSTSVLYQFSCVSECPISTVYDSEKNECLLCNPSCKTCSLDQTTCLSCIEGFYLVADGSCLVCDNNCLECEGAGNFCVLCKPNQFLINNTCYDECPTEYPILFGGKCISECPLQMYKIANQNTCQNTQTLGVSIKEIKPNFLYRIDFQYEWLFLFERINNFLEITPQCNESIKTNHQIENLANKSFLVAITFTNSNPNIPENCQLNFKFTIFNLNSDRVFELNQTHFTFNLSSCSEKFLKEDSSCKEKTKVGFSLDYTGDPTKISFQLSEDYNLALSQINSSLKLEIENYKPSIDYNYNLLSGDPSCSYCYIIQFSYNKPLYGRPLLKVQLIFSSNILYDFNFLQNNETKSIKLFDSYGSYESFNELVPQISQGYNDVNLATTSFITILSFVPSNSRLSCSLRSFFIIEIVFIIKYIDLNYPQVLRLYFMERMNIVLALKIFPPSFFQKNDEEYALLPQYYIFYQISPYFLEMSCETLAKLVVFFVLAIFILIIYNKANIPQNMNKKKKNFSYFISKLVNSIYKWLIWKYLLILFLSNHQESFFYAILSFYYPPLISEAGKLNFSLSLLYLLFDLVILAFISNVLKKRAEKNSENVKTIKKNQIFPSTGEEINKLSQENFFLKLPKSEKAVIPRSNNKSSVESLNDGGETLKSPNSDFDCSIAKKNKIFPEPISFKKDKIKMEKIKENDENGEKETISHLQLFEILFSDLKSEKNFQRYFLLVDITRQCLIVFFVVVLPNNPFAQICLINAVEILFFICSLMIKPFTNKASFINFIATELFVSCIFINSFIIGVLDYLNEENINMRISLGIIIIFSNFLFCGWILVFMIGGLLSEFLKRMKLKKKLCKFI